MTEILLDNGKRHAFAACKFLALQFAFCREWRKRGDVIRDPIGLNGGVNHANRPIETEVTAPQNLKSQRLFSQCKNKAHYTCAFKIYIEKNTKHF